jgi:hypothetical protein
VKRRDVERDVRHGVLVLTMPLTGAGRARRAAEFRLHVVEGGKGERLGHSGANQ